MSKRGLAIAQPGDSEDEDVEAVRKLKKAFAQPVSKMQATAISVLAREAGGRGKRKAKVQ